MSTAKHILIIVQNLHPEQPGRKLICREFFTGLECIVAT